jgi:hypothetical protein
MSVISKNSLKFDGTSLGEIHQYITSKIFASDYKTSGSIERVILRTDDKPVELNLYRVYKEYPLCLDQIKRLFKIYRTKYHFVTIEKVKYLACLHHNEISIDEYIRIYCDGKIENMRPTLVNEIQRIIAFNWLMCITSNSDNKIYVRRLDYKPLTLDFKTDIVYPFTFGEKGYSLDTTKCDIAEKLLQKWFSGSRELFYDHIKRLAYDIGLNSTSNKDESIDNFKLKIIEIINRVNPSLSPWVDIIYNRILSNKFLE